MNKLQYEDLERVYKLYGYESCVINGVHVYEYKHGRYFGADIYSPDSKPSQKIIEIEKMYKKQGFATSIKSYCSLSELEVDLFRSFFHADSFKFQLRRRYENFVNRQLNGLPDNAKYEYINAPYQSVLYENDGIIQGEQEYEISPIDKVIDAYNNCAGPLLTIIEAAAGYGKTCTAYEIVNRLCLSDTDCIPLYIELSRNREARIFKHVLQNEIELQFQNVVTSEVVRHQIIEGRIPIVIDGFDELLSKDFSTDSIELRDVESMLNTILDLLVGNSRIIITSRKTAIFSSEEFNSLIDNKIHQYHILRLTLSEPKISNWLDSSRIQIINAHNIPIDSISNPVLLAYLRNISILELKEINRENTIVDKYLSLLLEREQVRQNLRMTNETQLRIFKKLVRFMCEFNIKADEKSIIKELIQEYNTEILTKYIDDYPEYPKPTYSELADTLSNHVLLDRKANENIGFINDFVFGTLIGMNFEDGKFIEHYNTTEIAKMITEDFANLAVTAYRIQSAEKKNKLWKELTNIPFKFSQNFLFQKDIYLCGKPCENNYKNTMITDMVIDSVSFTQLGLFTNVVFSNCIFNNCKFNRFSFSDSGFVNCILNDCILEPITEEIEQDVTMYIISCNSNNGIDSELYNDNTVEETEQEIEMNIEMQILQCFFKSHGHFSVMRRVTSIRESLCSYSRKEISKAIEKLRNSKLIVVNGDVCYIQREGIAYFNKNFQK